ncbi:unnamed protein product, partial [Rotaria sordida]
IRKFNIDVRLVVADLPARAKITFLNGHAGYYACGNCLLEGSQCLRHRHILYTWSDYSQAQPHIRTQENIDSCAAYAELSGKKSYGVHQSSPLSQIISIPHQCVYDYFHLVYEGYMVMLLKEWKLLLKQVNIHYIDNLLNDVRYPHSFHRKPKDFNSFTQWKAGDLRTFFLYLALPLIIRLQPALSNKIVYHFSLLLISVRTLRHFRRRHEINNMKKFIHEYLKIFPSIYGRCRELLSTHILVHLPEQCIRHGGLSFHSMFTFESQLHCLRKMGHGSKSLSKQIAFWYTINKRLDTNNEYSIDLLTKQQLRYDIFFDENIRILHQQIYCHTVASRVYTSFDLLLSSLFYYYHCFINHSYHCLVFDMCASNYYSQKQNILSRKQYQSSQMSTYRSRVTTNDTVYSLY